jgi:3-oxoacyl-[acyl-carrier protein] reductase
LPDGGRVINIGSLSGEYGGPRTPSYAAAKAGVMALTHCLARFLGPRGVTVNCLSPGVIESDLTAQTMPASLRDKILPTILLGRLGRYEELTGAAVFLASDESSYMTAQTLSVNGGAWVR